MGESGRRAPEGRARRRVGRWSDAAAVALIAPDAGGAACEEAAALADASAEGRRTLLANLSSQDGLDGHLGVPEGRGLLQLGAEGLSLRDVARRPEGRAFVYLPAGTAEDAAPADHTAILRLMAKTAARIRERGGRLLLFVPEDGAWADTLAPSLDGAVLLEGAERRAGARALAPLEPGQGAGGAEPSPDAPDGTSGPGAGDEARDAPDADPADADGGEAEGAGWYRHRRKSGAPTTRIVLGGLTVAALLAGWWWLARGVAPESAGGSREVEAREAGGSGAAGADGADADASPGAGGGPAGDPGEDGAADGAAARDPGEVLAGARELPYSVLIASYAQWSQARGRLDRWREPGGPVYFVAPTRVRGGLYWRLFAGALPDRSSATGLMERLVERGRKDEVRAWDVRPVGLAFRVALERDREAADARAGELSGRGVPAYVVPAAAPGDTVWAVWSGGFESPEAAADLERLLEESEVEAELVTRRGEGGTE